MGNNNEEIPTPAMNNNGPRRFARSSKPGHNQRQMEITTRVIQLLHSNPFMGVDHEDPIIHLVKLYEIVESPGASDNEEENLYFR